MTLGTRSTHELKFAEVQQALGLGSDSEVEAWVVRAIGKVKPAFLTQPLTDTLIEFLTACKRGSNRASIGALTKAGCYHVLCSAAQQSAARQAGTVRFSPMFVHAALKKRHYWHQH